MTIYLQIKSVAGRFRVPIRPCCPFPCHSLMSYGYRNRFTVVASLSRLWKQLYVLLRCVQIYSLRP